MPNNTAHHLKEMCPNPKDARLKQRMRTIDEAMWNKVAFIL